MIKKILDEAPKKQVNERDKKEHKTSETNNQLVEPKYLSNCIKHK